MQFQHIPTTWPSKHLKFPRLMRLKAFPDVVVMFRSLGSGTCLASDMDNANHLFKIGTYYDGLIIDKWEDYREILQLKNDAE